MLYEQINTLDMFKPISDQIGLKYDSSMTYDERVKLRYDFVTEKLKENPEYEGWDYVEYCEYSRSESEAIKPLIYSNTALISTRGTLAKLKSTTGKLIVSKGSLSGRYLRITFRDSNNVGYKAYLHRIVACTFIPRSDDDKNVNLCNLVANHENNKNKFDNNFTNIKWMTQKKNIHHAINSDSFYFTNMNDVKPLLGRYIIPGKWFGTEFIISGKTEINKTGLNADALHQAARGIIKTAHGCEWEHITLEEASNINNEIPLELNLLMLQDKSKVNVTTKPVLGTITRDCPFKGQKFVVYGGARLKELGFIQGHVSRVCNGKASLKTHGGCKWEYVEQDEAEKYQRDPSPEQLHYLISK